MNQFPPRPRVSH
jgi:hypothetical protein